MDRKFVTALSRGLEVLRCFGPRARWLAKPTVSRLADTLTRFGHLRYAGAAVRERAGPAHRVGGRPAR